MNFLFINVCGINRRLKYPEFEELISEHDIIGFVETKTDDYDTIDVDGYIFKMKNRKKISNRKSGGIVLGFKEKLKKHIKVFDTDCNFVLWLSLSAEYCKTEEDIIFGIVYVPPENTRYSSQEAFDQIENELINFSSNHKYICLCGDFNGRTGEDLDFTENFEFDDENNLLEFIFDDSFKLEQIGVNLKRNSMDKNKNNFGNLFLQFCRQNSLFIFNGRINGDLDGKFTCRNSSVVDYFIGSTDLMNYVLSFNVGEFSSLFSDVHCHLSTKFDFIENENTLFENTVKIKKWTMKNMIISESTFSAMIRRIMLLIRF